MIASSEIQPPPSPSPSPSPLPLPLRMDILWETTAQLKCPLCKQDFDINTKGDHLYQCSHLSKKTKTKMHNKWRDMWWCNEMQTLIPSIQLTDSKIEKEAKGLIRSIRKSKVRPFDSHFNLPIVLNEGHFRCKLSNIGFDIIACNSDTCPSPSRGGSNAKSNNINIVASLLSADKSKFLHNIDKSKFPHGSNMAQQAFTPEHRHRQTSSHMLTPFGNHKTTKLPLWRILQTYKSPDPSTYYTQIREKNGSAGLAAIQKHSTRKTMARYPRRQSMMTKFHIYCTVQMVNLLSKEVDLSRPQSPLSRPQMLFLFTIPVIRA